MLELWRLYVTLDQSVQELDKLLPGTRELIIRDRRASFRAELDTAKRAFQTFIPFNTGELRGQIQAEYVEPNEFNLTSAFGVIYIEGEHSSRGGIDSGELADIFNIGISPRKKKVGGYTNAKGSQVSGYLRGKSLQRAHDSQSALAAVVPPGVGSKTKGWIQQAQAAAESILKNG